MGVKFCSMCMTTKPVEDFTRNRARPDGLATWCRRCTAEYRKKWELDKAGGVVRDSHERPRVTSTGIKITPDVRKMLAGMIESGDATAKDVADRLGVTVQSVSGWLRRYRNGEDKRGPNPGGQEVQPEEHQVCTARVEQAH